MNRIIILIFFFSVVSCQNGQRKENINNGIVSDTIQFPLRILPDNGWFLKLYPNSKYDYVYFSGFSSGFDTIENGTYKLVEKQIIFNSGINKSEFDSKNYYLFENNENGTDSTKCLKDKTKKYCLIIETE
ncbi:hypothetical protein [Olleya sp. 1-3]|uniref:hypothetical protein n=1 Tax=Olleya sp. 1-3 TaxID=2058323 RepID=UPI000C32C6D6|nr:hypothetical protein [Olleya sp. 1-3]PKG53476.1 hypothetical protein CXF54_01245 [Olleya sp. 1-3]